MSFEMGTPLPLAHPRTKSMSRRVVSEAPNPARRFGGDRAGLVQVESDDRQTLEVHEEERGTASGRGRRRRHSIGTLRERPEPFQWLTRCVYFPVLSSIAGVKLTYDAPLLSRKRLEMDVNLRMAVYTLRQRERRLAEMADALTVVHDSYLQAIHSLHEPLQTRSVQCDELEASAASLMYHVDSYSTSTSPIAHLSTGSSRLLYAQSVLEDKLNESVLEFGKDESFGAGEVFGFLPDGSGKNLNLPRTIMTPLPSATACLVNVPTTIGAGTVTAAVTSATTTGKSTKASKVASSSSALGDRHFEEDDASDLKATLRLNSCCTRPKGLLILAIALVTCVLLALRIQDSPTTSTSTRPSSTPSFLRGPNFDFDLFRTSPSLPEAQTDEEDSQSGGEADADEPESEEEEGELSEHEEETTEENNEDDVDDEVHLRVLHPPHSQSPLVTPSPHPFLPFTCSSCSDYSPSPYHVSPTCAKYSGPHAPNASFDPLLLDRTILFPGTGSEVRRVLRRAIKSNLFGAKRLKRGDKSPVEAYQDEESFQVLVLGGSVSNCRGVEPYTECWHSRVLDWFHKTIPLEGDPRDLVAAPSGPQRLVAESRPNVRRAHGAARMDHPHKKRGLMPKFVAVPAPKKHAKIAKPKGHKKKRPSAKAPGGRRRPTTKIINAAKSATGSAFFAYCLEAEMEVRGKSQSWGKGPDLIILEFGVNDVWPTTDVATRDFERLLSYLRALPSAPALIILEAASLLLARTLPTTTNAEYLHIAPAHFHDVPVLSTKNALFGPLSAIHQDADFTMSDLFLPDLHHPNARGHELLADTLTHYLEKQACEVQSQLLRVAGERVSRAGPAFDLVVDPELDILPRDLDPILPKPERSIFAPFDDLGQKPYVLSPPTCLQVGNAKSRVVPLKNKGWSKFSWARDKQYLVADQPGSSVTFDVVVGTGGEVLADWLRSRFYDLGNVLVFVDGQRASGVNLAGWWDLGWSIGVPTVVFSGLSAGPHTVTIELLPSHMSSHPSQKTAFRLIGIITT
ncbi:hypothetical protein P7C70_g7810, partial [Phenoliferia sp. Uapishka_3]